MHLIYTADDRPSACRWAELRLELLTNILQHLPCFSHNSETGWRYVLNWCLVLVLLVERQWLVRKTLGFLLPPNDQQLHLFRWYAGGLVRWFGVSTMRSGNHLTGGWDSTELIWSPLAPLPATPIANNLRAQQFKSHSFIRNMLNCVIIIYQSLAALYFVYLSEREFSHSATSSAVSCLYWSLSL